jgi:hypothetical protein
MASPAILETRKYTTGLRAHRISTLAAAIPFSIYTWGLARRWPLESAAQTIIVGGIWLVPRIAFEAGFWHYVAKHPWAELIADCDLRQGRIGLLLLLWLFALPYVGHRLA